MDRGLREYQRAIAELFARTGATSRFGLERTEAFLDKLRNPHHDIEAFHVAGTNGKGSVVATLYELLRARGLRVGRYTSPHLVDFRERIVVDDVEISEAEVTAFLSQWAADAETLGATFFEITTAMAFRHFAAQCVDVAIIETGLGGRLDATNVIRPVVAGVTSIGIEHTEYLGDTAAKIAAEKAGIFKKGVPAVFGPMCGEAEASLRSVAAAAHVSRLVKATDLFEPVNVMVSGAGTSFEILHDGSRSSVRSGLVGSEQAVNACIALAMLETAGPRYAVSPRDAAPALATVQLRGRFQRVGKNLICDVAHNPDAFEALARTLTQVSPPRPVVAILGILNDKDWRRMISIMSTVADELILTAPASAPSARAWSVADAASYAREQGLRVIAEPDLQVAVMRGMESGGTAVVTGSFHTVGDALMFVASTPSPP